MTMGNFFDNMSRRAKEVGEAGIERAKSVLGGLRGTAAPEAAVGNPNVGVGGSAEATAYNQAKAAQDAAFKQAAVPAPQASGIRGMAAKAGKLAGPVGAGLEEGLSLSGALSAGENPVKAVGRSALRGGATILGGAAGAGLGSMAGPVGTFAGGVAGATAGSKLGGYAADKIFGAEAKPGMPEAQAATPAGAPNQTVMEGRSSPDGDYLNGQRLIPVSDGGRATPEAASGLRSVVPQAGYGVIKRTTPGDEGAAIAVGEGQKSIDRDAQIAAQNAAAAQAKNAYTSLRAAGAGAGQKGVFGEMAALQGLRTKVGADAARDKASVEGLKLAEQVRGQDVTRENQQSQLAMKRLELAHTMGKENEQRIGERTADFVRGRMPAPKPGTFGVNESGVRAKYDADVKGETSKLNDQIAYSVAQRKGPDAKSVATLTDQDHQQLLDARKYKDAVEGERTNWKQYFTDFFGSKQFDSRNLYSYMPVKAEPATGGGYRIQFAGGNTAHITGVVGGKWNPFSPNDPVDADLLARVNRLIQEADKKGAK